MLKIKGLKIENQTSGHVTDQSRPRITYYVESDRQNTHIVDAKITIGNWSVDATNQIVVEYNGPKLSPYTTYTVDVEVTDNLGEKATESATFETGKFGEPWTAQWITDGEYRYEGKKVSPKTMTFQKKFSSSKKIKHAKIYATALGIYELKLNGAKVGKDYFAPGFTSYKHNMQYQVYDITKDLKTSNKLTAIVGGGWAVGPFTYARRTRVYAKRQAFLCEIRIEYIDGTIEVIGTNPSWEVTLQGNFIETEFYNGEVYDASLKDDEIVFHSASVEKININPNLTATYGAMVQRMEELKPVNHFTTDQGTLIYDFGQNFAGVISIKVNAKQGQKIRFKHAELLMNGELFTKPLRSAKQEIIYIAKDGFQEYSPTMTYMGFRYVSVEGIETSKLELSAYVLYSQMETTGKFECSNPKLNQLQSNIVWSAKSNFVDIPTDCPQRDERMGWTGDIALFSPTATFNFDTSRFLDKWLIDVKSEQNRGGGIPVTVPLVRIPQQYEIVFPMAVDHWGDACILVPWAEYSTRGDLNVLRKMYPAMKKYIKACEFWASLFSFGKHKYIWRFLHHYGDWVAPNVGLMTWMGRGRWTATASLSNTSRILAKIAKLLNEQEDEKYYTKLSIKTADAYRSILMKQDCTVKKEFQTAYVLPLHYQMLNDEDRKKTAGHLARMIRDNNYNIGTGFPGTPYVLFALADNGYLDEAYEMLLNDTCPSWLFMLKAGATTIWERWDALREDGTSNTGDEDGTHGMVSFNHYANGSVGDFLYRRIAGIDALEGGYKSFQIRPQIGGDLTWAKASVLTGYGKIDSQWEIKENIFSIDISVPVSTTCLLYLPNGEKRELSHGKHSITHNLKNA
ncbi:MAG: family 78 glycoside hydrolase catalytic domain [Acholeplasmataceae bacterium]|nr:family 78 glycoside hydrolase catalytic domain [Acholeplasmataceae bacterium]